MDYTFVHKDEETNLTVEISDLMIEHVAGSPQHNRYKLSAKVSGGEYRHQYDLYSDYTTNEYQVRKRGDKTELERVLSRLREVLHSCTVPFEWYEAHYLKLLSQ